MLFAILPSKAETFTYTRSVSEHCTLAENGAGTNIHGKQFNKLCPREIVAVNNVSSTEALKYCLLFAGNDVVFVAHTLHVVRLVLVGVGVLRALEVHILSTVLH